MEKDDEESNKSEIIGPLNFKPEPNTIEESSYSLIKEVVDIQCLFCDEVYQFYSKKDDYLAHLYLTHRLIIGDEEQVAIFHEYLLYWQNMFEKDQNKLAEYCTTMVRICWGFENTKKNFIINIYEKNYLLLDNGSIA